jgi:hypothetical protein
VVITVVVVTAVVITVVVIQPIHRKVLVKMQSASEGFTGRPVRLAVTHFVTRFIARVCPGNERPRRSGVFGA